jgi:signal recognition particle subunit SRP54
MRAVTGKPIKLIGVGEKMDALEEFDPSRIAGRILGMGDVVALVERAAEQMDAEKAAKTAERMRKGQFDLNDLRDQLMQMQRMGGMSGVMGLLPGMGKMKAQLENANLDDRVLKRQTAIIGSMTAAERRNPDLLKNSRKKRIAAGSGTKVEDINRLLKMHRQMADMMKLMGKGGRGGLAAMAGKLGIPGMGGMGGGMPGGLPPGVTPEMLEKMGKGGGGMPQLPPGGMPGLPPNFPGAPGGLPKLPGLGGFPGFGKKK